jgi:hypothetical protein
MSSFTTTITVDRTPEEAFAAINDVRGWWSGEIEGNTERLGDEFTYRYEDVHLSKQRITESIPGKRVAWEVLDGYLNFVQDKTEWQGTVITFDISKNGTRQRSGSLIRVWFRNSNASTTAQTRGASTSTAACGA